MIDYRKFRFSKLNTPEFRHLKYLFFWPAFVLVFKFLESDLWVREYISVKSPLDDLIPFNEYFYIPYMLWHLFVPGMIVWLLLRDSRCFVKMMRFIIVTYSITLLIYCLWPNCQHIRPLSFERDNLLTRLSALLYSIDTNTNVCPSIHVLGSLAAVFAAFHTPSIRNMGVKISIALFGLLICASTVFMKQHSVIDVFAGMILSIAVYPVFIWVPTRKNKVAVS